MKKVTKAVIAAAGLGTRFLPQTKAIPKEMLPVINKPIIQYVVEEAVAAGITDIIIVTGAHKRPIEDHFDRHSDLENHLLETGKQEMAAELRQIADLANFVYVRQKGPAGTGTPILNTAHLINHEPFLVLFGDDFFVGDVPRAVQLVTEFEEHGHSVIALTEISPAESNNDVIPYGVADIRREIKDGLFELEGLIEKPERSAMTSNFASVGGYVLTPDIIDVLNHQERRPDREFYLADAINTLAKKSKVYGKVIEGKYHDTGNKEKYLEAIVDVALSDDKLGPGFRRYLKAKLASNPKP